MFLGQAYAQFELFFGKKAPTELMRKVLIKELK
jgi:shikimate 5-dehydrogenase